MFGLPSRRRQGAGSLQQQGTGSTGTQQVVQLQRSHGGLDAGWNAGIWFVEHGSQAEEWIRHVLSSGPEAPDLGARLVQSVHSKAGPDDPTPLNRLRRYR